FLPKADDKADDKASDEANDDIFTLILVKGLGIYKHSFSYSSDSKQFQHDALMLDYPERIIDALKEFIEFIPLENDTTAGLVKQMTKIVIDPISENEPFTILNIRSYFNDNQIVWDKLDLSEHLKKS
ncbi:3413_t:CDS:2, partial [Gigaspora rosea]